MKLPSGDACALGYFPSCCRFLITTSRFHAGNELKQMARVRAVCENVVSEAHFPTINKVRTVVYATRMHDK
jgi:hypothetical protein